MLQKKKIQIEHFFFLKERFLQDESSLAESVTA